MDKKSPFDDLYGVQPVLNALRAQRRGRLIKLLLQGSGVDGNPRSFPPDSPLARIQQLAEQLELEIDFVDKHELNMRSSNRPHQGVMLMAEPLDLTPLDCLEAELPLPAPREGMSEEDAARLTALSAAPAPVWLALDEVMDPQNLGALLRSACFLGAAGVVLSAKNSATISPVVSKASAGAVELAAVHSTRNMPRFLNKCRENGWRVVGTALSGQTVPLPELQSGQPTILVLGNEGHGLRTMVQRACDTLVRIDRPTTGMLAQARADLAVGDEPDGDVDSLNVSVSGGILLSHLLRVGSGVSA